MGYMYTSHLATLSHELFPSVDTRSQLIGRITVFAKQHSLGRCKTTAAEPVTKQTLPSVCLPAVEQAGAGRRNSHIRYCLIVTSNGVYAQSCPPRNDMQGKSVDCQQFSCLMKSDTTRSCECTHNDVAVLQHHRGPNPSGRFHSRYDRVRNRPRTGTRLLLRLPACCSIHHCMLQGSRSRCTHILGLIDAQPRSRLSILTSTA